MAKRLGWPAPEFLEAERSLGVFRMSSDSLSSAKI